jgi:hypothetical protein
MALPYTTPGVYFEQVSRSPLAAFNTGVPAFLGSTVPSGLAGAGPVVALDPSAWGQLDAAFGTAWAGGYLPFAVRGFFQNGGSRCYVVGPGSSYPGDGLALIDPIDDIDLVCAPDLALSPSGSPLSGNNLINALVAGQAQLIDFCEGRGDWAGRPLGCFAILDSIGAPTVTTSAGVDAAGVLAHKNALGTALAKLDDPTAGASAALYAPWIKVQDASGAPAGFVPPCGHVAGIYASTDQGTGVFKPPANQPLQGAVDLQIYFDDTAQAALDPMPPGAVSSGRRLNCLRAFPGRGMRIWGAGTMSLDPTWTYVSARRLMLTIQRWFALTMVGVAFEPNDLTLWVRIESEVSSFLETLYDQGAFQGQTPDQAFYVKCDAETNPPAVRDAGMVVTEVGVAPVRPGEFIVVRLVGGEGSALGSPGGP